MNVFITTLIKTIYIREYDVFLLYLLEWMTTVNIDIAVIQ